MTSWIRPYHGSAIHDHRSPGPRARARSLLVTHLSLGPAHPISPIHPPARGGTIPATMLARLHLALLALSLSACAAHDGPVSASSRELEKPPPETIPHADLKIAIASVTLEQNCPDPPEPVVPASTTAAEAPAEPAPGAVGAAMPPAPGAPLARAKRSADAGPWQPPCNQSTMQLALSNTGVAPGTLRIKAIRLLDAASKKPLGTLNARRPSLWSDTGG